MAGELTRERGPRCVCVCVFCFFLSCFHLRAFLCLRTVVLTRVMQHVPPSDTRRTLSIKKSIFSLRLCDMTVSRKTIAVLSSSTRILTFPTFAQTFLVLRFVVVPFADTDEHLELQNSLYSQMFLILMAQTRSHWPREWIMTR